MFQNISADRLEALLEWWDKETAEWMDAWDSDREFTYGDETENALSAEPDGED